MPDSVCEIIRQAEQNYIYGTTNNGKYVSWSMYETIEKAYAYLNSKHTTGEKDSLGRDKPFFNIVSAATNIWYRATDLDRKDIRFIPSKSSSIVLAFVANVLLQRWMDKARFGQFLNTWGRTLAEYGSAVPKFVDKGDELVCSVVPWSRLVPDPVQFDALPRIEKYYKTPAQLKNMATPGHPDYAGYNMEAVESLVTAVESRKNPTGQDIDNLAEFIPYYEVHGLMDKRLLTDDKSLQDPKKVQYVQQMHVVSFVADENGDYKDFTLYKGREKQDPYMITHLIEQEGRTLSIGAAEYLFDSQWMHNHAMKNWKDRFDLASRQIFQTADTNFVGRNVLTAIETGDIMIHKENMPLEVVNNQDVNFTNAQSFIAQWKMMGSELTSTPDAIKGNTMPSGTPYSLAAYQGAQATSLFELMTENKGLALEDMMRMYVIPFLRRQLKNKDEVVAILDDAGIQEIDALYVPNEAIRRFNKRTIDQTFAAIENPNTPLPQQFNPQAEQDAVKQDLSAQGNKRFFKPDEIGQKQWNEIFADFEWDSLRVEVTNENVDKQATLQTLATLYTTTAQTDPVAANVILAKIMTETGVMSPLQIGSMTSRPTPQPAQSGAQLQDLAKTA